MPGDYRYLDESTVVVTTYWGAISILDILDTITRRIREMPEHHPRASVIDLSNATWTEVPSRKLHQEIEGLRPALAPPKVRTVFVAPGEYFYGFARMYAIVHVIYGAANVDVARSWSEAARMLDVDLATAEKWAMERAEQGERTETRLDGV
jgi:hypothetical protein